MSNMFANAKSFNQDISSVKNMLDMLIKCLINPRPHWYKKWEQVR